MSGGYCEVLLNEADCQHPPEMEGGPRLRTRCYRCGQVACKRCSALVGRIRICNDCPDAAELAAARQRRTKGAER